MAASGPGGRTPRDNWAMEHRLTSRRPCQCPAWVRAAVSLRSAPATRIASRYEVIGAFGDGAITAKDSWATERTPPPGQPQGRPSGRPPAERSLFAHARSPARGDFRSRSLLKAL